MIRRVAGNPPKYDSDMESFTLSLIEALQIPEVRAEIARIVSKPVVKTPPLARGQRTRKA